MNQIDAIDVSDDAKAILFILDNSRQPFTPSEAERIVHKFIHEAPELRYDGPIPAFDGGDRYSSAWNELILNDLISERRSPLGSEQTMSSPQFQVSDGVSQKTPKLFFDDPLSEECISGSRAIERISDDVMRSA